ncbi:hypothetical protein FDA94_34275 [Herbidospora galbida]|uniref:Lipoprotein n=1 Tax=Herbidospora galbida TaxID=2575442 RepID=A0A4U3LXW4_9ACTN|nr:hypothetical protein [Herbidospora galbida]TKK81058.1 hypothetical protein FDA94_34275 [Herbidospora galbida]
MRRLLIAGSALLLAGCGGLSEADTKACGDGRKLVAYALSITDVAPEELVGVMTEATGDRFRATAAEAADEGVKNALTALEKTMAGFRPTQVTVTGTTIGEQYLAKVESDRQRQENVDKLEATLRKQGKALNEVCGT